MVAARNNLETIDEYVVKMRNRVDFLAKEEDRMA